MQVEGMTETGHIRDNNEDYYLIDLDLQLFIVADGMGGHQAGEIASRLAVETVAEHLRKVGPSDLGSSLYEAVMLANEQVYRQSIARPDYNGMGTTLTAMLKTNGHVKIVHIGDSRAYLLRDGNLTLLTDDHTFVGQLLRLGEITERQAKIHPQRHLLTKALGTAEAISLELSEYQVQEGDILLLCTDGLTNEVYDEEIRDMIVSNKEIKQALDGLVRLALERGGQDNITGIIIKI